MRWCLAAVVAIAPDATALAARRKKRWPTPPRPRSAPSRNGRRSLRRSSSGATSGARTRLRKGPSASPDVRTDEAPVVADHCWLRGADARQFDETPIDATAIFDAEVETRAAGGPAGLLPGVLIDGVCFDGVFGWSTPRRRITPARFNSVRLELDRRVDEMRQITASATHTPRGTPRAAARSRSSP